MNKFTPWTGEDAVKAAALYVNRHTESGIRKIEERAFLKAVEWAAAQIEKCETITHGLEDGEFSFGDTHESKLVGVREVET